MARLRLYHGTTCANAEVIQRGGLKKQPGHIFEAKWYTVATDRASAVDHANGCVVAFDLDVPRPPPRKWRGYPFLWPPFKHDWKGRASTWYALREDLPASSVVRVTRTRRR